MFAKEVGCGKASHGFYVPLFSKLEHPLLEGSGTLLRLKKLRELTRHKMPQSGKVLMALPQD